ncbi:PREDICTED: metal transporter Nramp2-like [Ipomoea nil]|uniref:metal transporter Nramp2-like n=1 Tax=Ipomoea nil TaxID=35883 RepID=UPI000901BCB4|nr:PREDICTED: metal transporter Nramp2-like [Ipomoea nil]XP_019156776.1 PREDICTED: metal transporter Nramp2-like [Ipomoea nil]
MRDEMMSSRSPDRETTLHHYEEDNLERESLFLLPSDDDEAEAEAAEEEEKIRAMEMEVAADDDAPPPFSWRKLWEFMGPGFLMSVAFLDPGNLEGDIQAGAIAGYSLLWVLMWSTAMGLLIQLLSLRLGVATGRHLAEICREEYPYWATLLLWFMAELALIGADIQEVIGSAIAIKILSDDFIPLWVGVLITAFDCFIFLFLENYGVRKLEAIFAVLITTMALSFAWVFVETRPSGDQLMLGMLVPRLSSQTIQQAVGIVGCVITPHNVFLYSALVQSRQIDPKREGKVREALNYYTIESSVAVLVSFLLNLAVTTIFAKGFYGTYEAESIGLVNAGQFLQEKYGGELFPVLYIWGVGLLAAGQSSTMTGTYAGQFIMGGFLNLRMKKWLRSLITRSCAIVPTIIVAVVFNRSQSSLDSLNEWLNVVQGMQIPFAIIPLLTLVSNERIMGVFKIGTTVERMVWGIAAFVIVVNGYVMLTFFLSQFDGLLVGLAMGFVAAGYVAFLVYLIACHGSHSSPWSSNTNGFSHLES